MREKKTTIKYVSRIITYDEAYSVCQFCGKEVYDPKVADMNFRRLAFALSASQE
nr:MAG TPA: MqsA [Caudoviricetes sp.]